jgi:hypothetical protein
MNAECLRTGDKAVVEFQYLVRRARECLPPRAQLNSPRDGSCVPST